MLLNQYGGSFIRESHGESPFTECIGARKDCVCPTSVNEMPAGKTLPCQKEACAIQKCLQGTIASRLENSSLYVYIYFVM